MKRFSLVLLGVIGISYAAQAGFVPDFIAQQCGGSEIKFKLTDHRGSWVVLNFLLPGDNPTGRDLYSDYEQRLDELIYGHNIKPVFFKPGEKSEIANWWESLDSNRIPVLQDPNGKLSRALKIPYGLKSGDQITLYPTTLLLDPEGNEVFRKVGKSIEERIGVEELLREWEPLDEKYSNRMAETDGEVSEEDWIQTESGLKYVDLKEGQGPAVKRGNLLTVQYTGSLENGKKFDSSLDRDEPFTFPYG
ncbi:MAG: redoxin domain-containing protein, partial [Candidatus Omnitrophica bacterium]|nr:redoxin domain-containing protein [Candidatus Omnitrophota bacterium]